MKRTLCLCISLALLFLSSCSLPLSGGKDALAPEGPAPCYEALAEAEQTAYRAMYAGLKNRKAAIRMRLQKEESFEGVFSAVLNDHPELMGVSRKGLLYSSRGRFIFQPRYLFSPEEELERSGRLHEKLREVAGQVVKAGMDDYEKELALHDWLLDHCRYDEACLAEGKEDDDGYTAYGALISGRAVCEGFAKAFALLLREVDIPSTLVVGEARQDKTWEKHMWNAVWLDGEAYYVDPTWNLNDALTDRPFHTYFNVTEAVLARDHRIEAGGVTARAEQQNFFVRGGLRFSQYDKDAKAAILRALENETRLELAFTTTDAFRFALKRLVDEQEIFALLAQARPGEDPRNLRVFYNSAQFTMQFSDDG